MKILHIAYFGKYGKITGIVESVMNMATSQELLGHDVRVYIPFRHPLQDNRRIYYIESFSYIARQIKEYNPDIVIFDGFYDKYQIRLSYLLKYLRIPYVIVFHGGASSRNAKKNWFKKKVANILFFNRFVRWAKRVVYLSENEMLCSIFLKINQNISIIPNGVKITNVENRSNNQGRLKILFLSRLDWYGKGLDLLYDAIRILYEKGFSDRLEFLFYGIMENTECERLFSFGNMTKYCGYVTGDDKKTAFSTSDIFILPSRSEGMPMAVLESLSYGLPCIVTPETNMATLIENNNCGWVIDLSIESIVDTIKRAYTEFRQNSDVYHKNCISVAAQFSWDKIANKSLELYKEIIENND